MLCLLQQKADSHKISLDTVMLCRMNALEIPLAMESVDTVVADSVLHLISNPQKVIAEILCVLKKGGHFICRDDRPGKSRLDAGVKSGSAQKCGADGLDNHTNAIYQDIVNTIYCEYWKQLEEYNVFPVKYSWKFNRDKYCEGIFADKKVEVIERGNLYEMSLKDGSLPRFSVRGFSDQVDVPEDDLVITIYTKAAES